MKYPRQLGTVYQGTRVSLHSELLSGHGCCRPKLLKLFRRLNSTSPFSSCVLITLHRWRCYHF